MNASAERIEWERAVLIAFIANIPCGEGVPDPADYIHLLTQSMLTARDHQPRDPADVNASYASTPEERETV